MWSAASWRDSWQLLVKFSSASKTVEIEGLRLRPRCSRCAAQLQQVGIEKFRRFGKQKHDIKVFRKGQKVGLDTLSRLTRLTLQDRVEVGFCVPRKMYLHFGFDFLVYVGLAKPTPAAKAFALENGIFLEEMASPYRRRALRRKATT
jgi:hypothetical protein